MASNESASEPTGSDSNHDIHVHTPPQVSAGSPSIISSRMTDIASENGDHDREIGSPTHSRPASQLRSAAGTPTNKRRSIIASEAGTHRPETARTGTSARAWSTSQPLRKTHLQHAAQASGSLPHRGSISGNSTKTTTTLLSRSGSKGHNSRSHVPSVANQAFFHPMSSQKLQAQRAGATGRRTSETPSTHSALFAAASISTATAAANFSAGLARMGAPPLGKEGEEGRAPPSRGTEWTEQETLERLTATSPTGHLAQESISESRHPLHKRRDRDGDFVVDTSRPYVSSKNAQEFRAQMRSPQKTPRSFRSSLFIRNGQNWDTTGAEKLSSAAPSESHGEDDDDIKRLPHSPGSGGSGGSKGKKSKDREESSGKVYEYFDGNTVFCLSGRLQNTHAKPINIATGVLVAIPMVLFLVFPASWFWDHMSPAVPVIFAYLAYLCMSSFLRASTSDPGILPRNLHSFPEADPNSLAPQHATNEWVLMKSADASTAAMEVPVKHCRTCNIWRPPRAHHCRLCDNCIEGHDHHCVWLNNCVGRRNYRFFFTFVSSAAILSFYMVGVCIAQLVTHMNQEDISFSASIKDYPVSLALIIYGFIAGLYPAALMGYHVFLMSRGETTREYINSHKFPKNERYRAFNQGPAWRNWMVVLCRPRPPTLYQFKKSYQPGDQRLGAVKRELRKRDSVELQNVRPVGTVVQSTTAGFQGPSVLRAEQQQQNKQQHKGDDR